MLEAALERRGRRRRASSRRSTRRSPARASAARASTSTRSRRAPAATRRSSSTPSTSPSSARSSSSSRQSQKMEAVGQLAGGIAHDFNNVLTAIIGFSDLLLANHRPSDPSFQDIMNIKQNANRAAGLVRQLLAFSRRQTLRPQVLALGDVLSDLSILLERLLGENVKLQLVHGRDLWPIKVDLNQFEQVIINLAVNARDAMPNGGTMTIRTRNLPAAEVAQLRLPAAAGGRLRADRGRGHRHRHAAGGAGARSSSRSSRPRKSARAPASASRRSTASSSRPARTSSSTSVVGKGTIFRIFVPRHVPAEGEKSPAGAEADAEIADLTGTATHPAGRGRGGGARLRGARARLARLQGLRGGVGRRGARGDGGSRRRRSISSSPTWSCPSSTGRRCCANCARRGRT